MSLINSQLKNSIKKRPLDYSKGRFFYSMLGSWNFTLFIITIF